MIDVVVDSSAILAVIKGQPGAQRVNDEARGGRISALNYCEIVGWLAERGSSTVEIDNVVAPFNLTIEHFDSARAGSRVAQGWAPQHIPRRSSLSGVGHRAWPAGDDRRPRLA